MPTYQEKPVEAFQITEDNRFDQTDWPDWLKEAWRKEASEDNSFHETGSGMLLVQTPRGYEPVSDSDWIVQGRSGRLHRYPDEEFEQHYEPVGAAKEAKPKAKTKPKEKQEEPAEDEGVATMTTQGMRNIGGRKNKKKTEKAQSSKEEA